MSDLSNYRQRVTDCGQKATAAEAAENYEEAYKYYISALEIFMHLIKCNQRIFINNTNFD